MKYKIVIIDDEKKAVEAIRIIINEFVSDCQVVGSANSAVEGVRVINETQPDIVLLDIEMPSNSGFDMLEMLPEKKFETIFVTAYDQYAIKAIKFSAFDYLLKPVSIQSLNQSIEKFIEHKEKRDLKRYDILESALSEKNPNKIALTYAKGIRYVSLSEIIYLSSDRSYTTVYFDGGDKIVLTNKSLTEFESLLEPDFFRIHRSYLVNTAHIDSFSNIDGGIVIMKNGDELLLSRRKRDSFFELMNQVARR